MGWGEFFLDTVYGLDKPIAMVFDPPLPKKFPDSEEVIRRTEQTTGRDYHHSLLGVVIRTACR